MNIHNDTKLYHELRRVRFRLTQMLAGEDFVPSELAALADRLLSLQPKEAANDPTRLSEPVLAEGA